MDQLRDVRESKKKSTCSFSVCLSSLQMIKGPSCLLSKCPFVITKPKHEKNILAVMFVNSSRYFHLQSCWNVNVYFVPYKHQIFIVLSVFILLSRSTKIQNLVSFNTLKFKLLVYGKLDWQLLQTIVSCIIFLYFFKFEPLDKEMVKLLLASVRNMSNKN